MISPWSQLYLNSIPTQSQLQLYPNSISTPSLFLFYLNSLSSPSPSPLISTRSRLISTRSHLISTRPRLDNRVPKKPPVLRERWLQAIGRTEDTIVNQVSRKTYPNKGCVHGATATFMVQRLHYGLRGLQSETKLSLANFLVMKYIT